MVSPGGMMMTGVDTGAAAGGGYPTGPPHMGMGMGIGMPPPAPGFPPQPGTGAGAVAQQHTSGFVTGEAAAAMAGKKPKKFVRVGANKEETYEDPTLNEWPDSKCVCMCVCVFVCVCMYVCRCVCVCDWSACRVSVPSPAHMHPTRRSQQTTSGSSVGTWATT